MANCESHKPFTTTLIPLPDPHPTPNWSGSPGGSREDLMDNTASFRDYHPLIKVVYTHEAAANSDNLSCNGNDLAGDDLKGKKGFSVVMALAHKYSAWP